MSASNMASDHLSMSDFESDIDKWSLTGGSHYDAPGFTGFRMKRIRVCPVTLCVLGRYPKYLYVKRVS